MIGFYDYTVVMTYISLIFTVAGITQVVNGNFKVAIMCLAMSGFCDMFDGKIARTKKNRTEDEKAFGVQLDSLCDVVCFGIFPTILCYKMGVNGPIGMAILFFYAIAAVIRLAYFNVLEAKPKEPSEPGERKCYHGLPVTSIAVILPVAFLVGMFVHSSWIPVLLHIVLLATGLLFIVDFRFVKPTNKQCALLVSMTGSVLLVITLLSSASAPMPRLRTWLAHTRDSIETTAYVEEQTLQVDVTK